MRHLLDDSFSLYAPSVAGVNVAGEPITQEVTLPGGIRKDLKQSIPNLNNSFTYSKIFSPGVEADTIVTLTAKQFAVLQSLVLAFENKAAEAKLIVFKLLASAATLWTIPVLTPPKSSLVVPLAAASILSPIIGAKIVVNTETPAETRLAVNAAYYTTENAE